MEKMPTIAIAATTAISAAKEKELSVRAMTVSLRIVV